MTDDKQMVQLRHDAGFSFIGSEPAPPPQWEHAPAFGDYLRAKREDKSLTVREAAKVIGISHGYLAKIERGAAGFRKPRHEMLHRAAGLFGVTTEEMFSQAGYSGFPVPVSLDAGGPRHARTRNEDRVRHQFRAIVLHPKLRPDGLDEDAMEFLPVRVMEAWLDYAMTLERHLRAGGDSIEVLGRTRWEEVE